MKHIMIMALLFCSTLYSSESSHKIVYLLSGPRTLSTVFLRMMESRGDFIIFNEPTIPAYDKIHYAVLTSEWFRSDAYHSFVDVKKTLFEAQEKVDVFVKDMSFSTYDFFLSDPDFVQDPSLYFIFLVRNPHHTCISFHQKLHAINDSLTTSDLIGLEKLYKEYEYIRKINPNGVKIIFSEDLYQKPQQTMEAFCSHLNIPFTDKMFTWKKYGDDFKGFDEWNEQKKGDQVHHWHGRAIQSEKLQAPQSYAVDAEGNPTFEEIENFQEREKVIEIYRENLIYYLKFLEAQDDFLN